MQTDPRLRPQLNPQLEAGEWVYWAGKPLPLRMALGEREALILGVLALAVLVILQIIYSRTYIFSVPLLGVALSVQWIDVFFGVTALLCFAQPIYQYWVASKTIYAITDRRAFTLKPTRKGPIVQSYKNIQQIKRRDLPEGRGDLIFGTKRLVTNSARFGVRVHTKEIGFFGIDHARDVEQLMIKTFRNRDNSDSGTERDESL